MAIDLYSTLPSTLYSASTTHVRHFILENGYGNSELRRFGYLQSSPGNIVCILNPFLCFLFLTFFRSYDLYENLPCIKIKRVFDLSNLMCNL